MKRLVVLFIAIFIGFLLPRTARANVFDPSVIQDWELMCTYKDVTPYYYSPSTVKIIGPMIYSIPLMIEIAPDDQETLKAKFIVLVRVVDLIEDKCATVSVSKITPDGEIIPVPWNGSIEDFDYKNNEVDFAVAKTLVNWTKAHFYGDRAGAREYGRLVDERVIRVRPDKLRSMLERQGGLP